MVTETTTKQASPELLALVERIENGIRWLSEHDPTGSFHLWFESGILPVTPLPAQDEVRREEWKAYFKNRTVFERLWREMESREKLEGLVEGEPR